ncbi:hypothetical protein I302_108250 [Kwoniella bestiolae CBS 10118]|uniref:Uncharacterized protein n=1 Tax=Kwoniella bestiolae CBS 10118 TaxID=1296100 RepID=A0A1B9FW83_9TREE|nr:hypothetical protein I302_07384 [Kwoniella bestiolae CBS 10118]OCF23034.1 hypothetical protein I302_07384 [Kwoniella bestiolae CBS 10118]
MSSPLPDPTLFHLLSLPPLLQPISPPLAALHLARVRLSLSIPTSSTYLGKSLDDWCNLCGGLRLNLGGTTTKKGRRIGVKRRNWKGTVCGVCGEKYKKGEPDRGTIREHPPARRTRRMKLEQEGKGKEKETQDRMSCNRMDSGNVDAHQNDNNGSTNIHQIQTMNEDPPFQSTSIIHPTTSQPPPPPLPPKFLSRPSLSHIPTSSPNLPTYPQPPPVSPPSNAVNTGIKKSSSSAGIGVGAAGGAKRKKKSGLAKLLAENKEREALSKGQGGMWGLG